VQTSRSTSGSGAETGNHIKNAYRWNDGPPRWSGTTKTVRAFLSAVCADLLTPLVNYEQTPHRRGDTLSGIVGCRGERARACLEMSARDEMLRPSQGQIQNGKFQESVQLENPVVAVLSVSVRAKQIQAVARQELQREWAIYKSAGFGMSRNPRMKGPSACRFVWAMNSSIFSPNRHR
jgi:hypothetical protein